MYPIPELSLFDGKYLAIQKMVSPNNGQSESDSTLDAFRSIDLQKQMSPELVLLSWLVVLSRSRQGTDVRFEWGAYSQSGHELITRTMVLTDVIPDLQGPVSSATTLIAKRIVREGLKPESLTSIILSTDDFSKQSGEAKDQVSIFELA